MPPRICHEIARMAEEGINNAHKHSKASTFTVRVGSIEGNWMLVMVDDGVGFDFKGTWPLERLVTSAIGPRVIKERVLSLNGNLMIESTPTGARIEISIPKSNKLMNPFQTLTPSKRGMMSPTQVLIVDDHAIFRQGLRKLFDEHPEFNVVGEAASGAEAVTAVKQLSPDILLLDLQLGDMTGLDVLRRLAPASRPRPFFWAPIFSAPMN